MKTIVEQLSTYKSVHLNKKNIKTHFVGVPLIVWAIFVLFSLIQLPIKIPTTEIPVTFAMLFVTGV
ncbi:MAG: Mpo1-like protein, partial [Kangiellaceae bacterium]